MQRRENSIKKNAGQSIGKPKDVEGPFLTNGCRDSLVAQADLAAVG